MKSKKVEPLLFPTYLAVIKNSIGSKLFQNFYAKVNGNKVDIMQNGKLSCAFFVSSILIIFQLSKKTHATVVLTVKDMEKSGWVKVKKPKAGSVIVWEEVGYKKNDIHKHIGFYIGNNQAVSNSYKRGHPIKHHWTFNGKRKVEVIYWNKKLS